MQNYINLKYRNMNVADQLRGNLALHKIRTKKKFYRENKEVFYCSTAENLINKIRFFTTKSNLIRNINQAHKTTRNRLFSNVWNFNELLELMQGESTFDSNMKLVDFSLSFPTNIRTRQSDSRSSSYDFLLKVANAENKIRK